MINLLITEASWQLGTEIQPLTSLYPNYTLFFTHKNELDISNNIRLNQFLMQNKIHIINNGATYTVVDKTETESILSSEIHHLAVKNLAIQTKEIMKMAKLTCKVLRIETKDYPTPAKRHYYSVLNKRKIKDDFGLHIPYWKDSLSICLKQMGAKI